MWLTTRAGFVANFGSSNNGATPAAAQKRRMFLCVQDLTCPGASLIHSAGLAAHVPGVAAVEANARQYMPAANRPWEERLPGLFRVTDGTMETGVLTGPAPAVLPGPAPISVPAPVSRAAPSPQPAPTAPAVTSPQRRPVPPGSPGGLVPPPPALDDDDRDDLGDDDGDDDGDDGGEADDD